MTKNGKTPIYGWGGHLARPRDPIKHPKTKSEWIRYWAETRVMQVPSRSGKPIQIDIYYASNGAAEARGGRAFDSLVSLPGKAFFVLFVERKDVVVEPATNPILVIPGLDFENAWWVLPHALNNHCSAED